MRTQLQSEAADCGLACLFTISRMLGGGGDFLSLRRRFPPSQRGASLSDLMDVAAAMGLGPRAARAELDDVADLQLPCVLHWNGDHFVVLHRIRRGRFHIADPAVGDRVLSRAELSRSFTGIALELTPTLAFRHEPTTPALRWSRVLAQVRGLPWALARIAMVGLVLEVFLITGPLLQQLVVDEVLVSGDLDLLAVLVGGFGLLVMLQTAIGVVRSWMTLVLGQELSLQWTTSVFATLVRLPIDFFERRHLGDIASKFDSVAAIQRVLTQSAVEAALDALMAFTSLVMMLMYSPALASVAVSAVGLYGVLRWASLTPYRNAAAERLLMESRENSFFLETLRAMVPLKLFGRETQRQARWQSLHLDVQNRDLRTARLNLAFGTARDLITGVEHLLLLWIGAHAIQAQSSSGGGALSIGMLFAFLAYKQQFSGRAHALIGFVVEVKTLAVHTERLADIVLTPREDDGVAPADLSHLPATIELHRVSFRHAPHEPWILRDVSLRIEAGSHVAVVGASGSGKSTLLRIALGLLPPTEGDVLYGGLPMRRLGAANVRRCMGTVMQEDVLLTGSIEDNVTCFDATPSRERLIAATRAARMYEEVQQMPMGYASLIGDLGAGLSGGQRQRLLIARCLYRQPRVIVLDEATSHLDPDNERAILTHLAQLRLTRLSIAHRSAALAGADRVVHLHNAALTELSPSPSPSPSAPPAVHADHSAA